MKQEAFTRAKIIDCLLKNKKMPLRSSDNSPSFFSEFKLNDNLTASPFSERTIYRALKQLCDIGVFYLDENKDYNINRNFFSADKSITLSEWESLFHLLLKNGEFETYYQLKKLLGNQELFNEVDLTHYEVSIKESSVKFESNKEIINLVNNAIEKKYKLQVKYKNKIYLIQPICYVVSRDKVRSYLYALHRNTLLPMELKEIKIIGKENGTVYDREEYLKIIDDLWDIDTTKKQKIKLLFRKEGKKYYEEAFVTLNEYFGTYTENDDGYIYEGNISGINDFKKWLRHYMDMCIVLEPETLRNEFKNALIVKRERYDNE